MQGTEEPEKGDQKESDGASQVDQSVEITRPETSYYQTLESPSIKRQKLDQQGNGDQTRDFGTSMEL